MTNSEELKKLKEKVYWIEFNMNGLKYINGADVKVLNLKIIRKKDLIIADIILCFYDDNMNTKQERYDNCEYKLSCLEKLK